MENLIGKIVWLVIKPSTLIWLLLLASLLAWAIGGRLAGPGRSATVVLAVGVVLLGVLPVGSWLMYPLETRFPRPDTITAEDIAGIVVLGGAIEAEATTEHEQLVLNDAGERTFNLLMLKQRFPELPIIFTGGTNKIGADRPREADMIRATLPKLGIGEEGIIFERESRNTWQNATLSKPLRPNENDRPWLLVTSAWHMPRAIGAFRQAGWQVIPFPVDRRVMSKELYHPRVALSDRLQRLDLATSEWAGLAWYRVTGRSSAIFPAPD